MFGVSRGVSELSRFGVRSAGPRRGLPRAARGSGCGHYGGPMEQARGAGRRRQDEVYRAGVYGHSPVVPTAARALQRRAKEALNARAYAYVAGGGGGGGAPPA